MIGVLHHIHSTIFRFHFHSQKVSQDPYGKFHWMSIHVWRSKEEYRKIRFGEERLLDGLNFLRQMIDPPPEVSHFNSPWKMAVGWKEDRFVVDWNICYLYPDPWGNDPFWLPHIFLGWKHQRSRRSDFLGSKKCVFFLGGMVTSSCPLICICEGRSTSIVFLYHLHHVLRYISVRIWFITYTFGGVYANTLQGHFA